MWTSVILEMKNTTEKIEFKGNASIRIEPLTGDANSTNKYETTYSQPFELGPQTISSTASASSVLKMAGAACRLRARHRQRHPF